MHRRSIQCLEIPGARASLRRHYNATAAVEAAQPASANPFSEFRRRPVPQEGVAQNVVRKETERIVRNAARGERRGWKITTTFNGGEVRLRSAVGSAGQPPLPSLDKNKFFSGPTEDAVDDLLVTAKVKLPPGTFVELRRNYTINHGVIIKETHSGTYLTLMSSGEIWEHQYQDVMFAMPDFVPQDAVAPCGIVDRATNEHEANARVQVLKQTRALEKGMETEFHKIAGALDHALNKAELHSREPGIWKKITTTQAARLITTKRIIPLFTLLCVHKCLMGKPKIFIADQRDYIATQTFTIRPPDEVEDLETVTNMIHRGEESLMEFVKKARTLISASRSKPPLREGTPSVTPNEDCTFTEEDQVFIRLLLQFLRTSRTIQTNATTIPVSVLVKMIDMYPGKGVSSETVHEMLVEMGVLPPWDDPVFRDALILKNAEYIERRVAAGVPALPTPPLGPDDFYPRDIVASIRHDFGNMPVYVIDDAGAKELDDGLSVEPVSGEAGRHWVHVHIADPTALLHPDHKFSRLAHEAIESRYFIPASDPLLPMSVVYSGMSLGSGRGSTKVMTFSFKVDEIGDITDYLVRPGLVHNVNVLRYQEVNDALGIDKGARLFPFGRSVSPPSPPAYSTAQVNDLRMLLDAADRLVSQRQRFGVMLFANPEVEMKMLTDPPSTESTSTSPSHFNGFPELQYMVRPFDGFEYGSYRIVAEAMKGACRVASRFFRDRGVPAIRRAANQLVTKTDEDMQYLKTLRDKNCYVDYSEILKLQARVPSAENTLQVKGHWQLGVPDGEGYVRVTSPLRRYCDMVAHWQIKQALLATTTGKNPAMFTDQWLRDLAAKTSIAESYNRIMERRDRKYWAIKYLDNLFKDPQRPTEKDKEVLENLVAHTVLETTIDLNRNMPQTRISIPALGLSAVLLTPRGVTPELGRTYPVAIDDLRLGLNPDLFLKLRQ